MSKEVQVKIKPSHLKAYKDGFPLIEKDALIDPTRLQKEGVLLSLVDERNQFIAKGYYGRQNKGYGWILSHQKNEQINGGFFDKKITAAFDERKPFFESEDTNAFRVFNGEGDGIGGMTIDYFDGYYLIQWYSEGIYSFKGLVLESLEKQGTYKGIYEKKRFDTAGKYLEDDDFVAGIRGEFPLLVKENGVQFAIYLNDGAMVGVFLDQREVRKTIRDKYAKGKTMLNMFSYTGAFSVFAALGGATKTTSVDLANRSRAKTKEQFEINGIDADQQEIIVEDVFHYFKYALKKERSFDLVVLDPPSFARSKKYTFKAEKDYTNLLKETIAITNENGVIVASTNCSTFGMKKFKAMIAAAFIETGNAYKIVEEFSLPADFKTIGTFREGDYLKVVFIQRVEK